MWTFNGKAATICLVVLAVSSRVSLIEATLCAANQYVESNACVNCAAGTTNPPGDDDSGADTTCAATLCAANQYVSSNACEDCAAGTSNAASDDASGADTTCDVNTCLCMNGTAATGAACTADNAVICTACQASGFFLNSTAICLPWAGACSVGQHESQAPSGTQDRVCTQNMCTCDNVNGTEATGTDCTADGTNMCTDCAGDFYLDASNCVAWTVCSSSETETQAPDITQNRVCVETACINVTCTTPPESGNCYNSAGTCAAGACTYAAAAAGTSCNDNNAVTTNDECDGSSGGVAGCAGTDPACVNVTCAAAAACRQAGVCEVGSNGTCTYALSAADSACDDGNADTTDDKCSAAGVCAGTTAPAPSTSSAATLLSVLALAVPVWVAQV